jgi:hypothetical protein
MRIQLGRKQGSVIIVMMVFTVLIGITLGSYLHMVSNQNLSVMRSMAWNHAVAVAEAGIEDAMAQLNMNTTNRTRDGWTLDGTNVVKQRFVGENKYRTWINVTVEPPRVISEGWVINPKDGQFLPRPRVVSVTTTNDALFAKGMVAKGLIDLRGNRIRTDSFDSTDNDKSNNGRYDNTKAGDKGDVATNSQFINVANAEIWGKASTGPGGTVQLSANGAVGDRAWHLAGNTGIKDGWSSDDMNVQFPDVKDPYLGTGIIPSGVLTYIPPLVVGGIGYDYMLVSGNYLMGNLDLNNKKMLVMGNATLKVTGDIAMTGNGQITIATNASLNLYMAGDSANLSGNGIVNNTGRAGAFSYWGMNSNEEVTFSGNADFVGTIYAPHADFTMGGSGRTEFDFSGASVTKSVSMNGHFNFHYDESLGEFGPRRSYTVVSWNESSWNEL